MVRVVVALALAAAEAGRACFTHMHVTSDLRARLGGRFGGRGKGRVEEGTVNSNVVGAGRGGTGRAGEGEGVEDEAE